MRAVEAPCTRRASTKGSSLTTIARERTMRAMLGVYTMTSAMMTFHTLAPIIAMSAMASSTPGMDIRPSQMRMRI